MSFIRIFVNCLVAMIMAFVFVPAASAKGEPAFRVKELGVVCWANGDSAYGFRIHNQTNVKRDANFWYRNTDSGFGYGNILLTPKTGVNHWIRIDHDDPMHEFYLWAGSSQNNVLLQAFDVKPLDCPVTK